MLTDSPWTLTLASRPALGPTTLTGPAGTFMTGQNQMLTT